MNKRLINLNFKMKLIIGVGVGTFLLLLISVLLFLKPEKAISGTPTLTIETAQKIRRSEKEEFSLDVTVSSLGDAIYPAASMSVSFDSSRLEFIGVEDGNVFISNNEGDVSKKLPDWSYNTEECNKSGKINIMYLDTTGGKNAFSKELLAKEDNVLFRLKFRLKDGLESGEVCDLIFDDAIFAALDENESLAMTTDTLFVRNGKIVIGE